MKKIFTAIIIISVFFGIRYCNQSKSEQYKKEAEKSLTNQSISKKNTSLNLMKDDEIKKKEDSSALKTFKSEKGGFIFAYPTYLEETKINNAPHMLLKLNSPSYTLTISLWEDNLDSTVTIWDSEVVSVFRESDRNNPNTVVDLSCDKIYLTLNGEKTKSLKSVTNTNLNSNRFKVITYRLLHKGNYLQFCFFVFEDSDYWDDLGFSENIMRGLVLNENEKSSNSSETEKQIVKFKDKYQISLPFFMKTPNKIDGFDNIRNPLPFVYIATDRILQIAIVDKPINEVGATNLQEYADFVLSMLRQVNEISIIEERDENINDLSSKVYYVIATDIHDEKYFHIVAVVKGKSDYYNIQTITKLHEKDKEIKTMNEIIYSFKEL